MVRPARNDRTLRIQQLANEIEDAEWPEDEPTTITEVPSTAPPVAKGIVAVLLALPPWLRAVVVGLVFVLAAGTVSALVWLAANGAFSRWLSR